MACNKVTPEANAHTGSTQELPSTTRLTAKAEQFCGKPHLIAHRRPHDSQHRYLRLNPSAVDQRQESDDALMRHRRHTPSIHLLA